MTVVTDVTVATDVSDVIVATDETVDVREVWTVYILGL